MPSTARCGGPAPAASRAQLACSVSTFYMLNKLHKCPSQSLLILRTGLRRQEQQQKLELCLEALGERAERIASLEADMAEMRAVFRGALEEAVGQLAEARAAAAAATSAAAAAAAAQPQQTEASAAASNGT